MKTLNIYLKLISYIFIFFIFFTGCKISKIKKTLFEKSKTENEIHNVFQINDSSKIKIDKVSYSYTCGTDGCVIIYTTEKAFRKDKMFEVFFKVTTYIEDEITDVSFVKYSFEYGINDVLISIHADDQVNILKDDNFIIKEDFIKLGKRLKEEN